MTTTCEALTENGKRCHNDATCKLGKLSLCGVHTRGISEEMIQINNCKENFVKGGKLLLEKTEKTKKIKYKEGYYYVYPAKNNRKKGLCLYSLSLKEIKNVECDGIRFKNLEDLFFSSLKFEHESMEEFREKQRILITKGGHLSDNVEAEQYFIGNREYSAREFRYKIFNIYASKIRDNKDFLKLYSLYKSRYNIVIAGNTAYSKDIEDFETPFMVEGMICRLLETL